LATAVELMPWEVGAKGQVPSTVITEPAKPGGKKCRLMALQLETKMINPQDD